MADILVVIMFSILVFFVLAQVRILVLILFSVTRDLDRSTVEAPPSIGFVWPTVVVQLPVYREHKVLRRLLSAVVDIDYPEGQLAVQVLDDSEDEELALSKAVVDQYCDGDVPIAYVQRGSRDGFKSGALNMGTRLVDADLVAIFDADFVPDRKFLLETVPLFADATVGAVHTRWRHRNDTLSPLTLLQAAILDSLFCFLNGIRQAMGESTIYLGTSGVWRKSTVEELGGWREAPFTDDGIDLSFRAQLAGWSVLFVNDALASSDLPASYVAYKSQQRRWARAVFRLFLDFWRSALRPGQGNRRRFLELSALHLVLSTPALILAGLLTSAYVALGLPRTPGWMLAQVGLGLALVLFPPTQECMLSQRLLYENWARRCLRLLPSWPLGIGVSISILAGFWDAIRHDEPEFVRTPKEGSRGVISRSTTRWDRTASRVAAVETGLGIAFLGIGLLSIVRGYAESWLLLLALAAALLIASARSWSEIRRSSSHAG